LTEHKTGFYIKTRSGALLTNLISPKPERTFLAWLRNRPNQFRHKNSTWLSKNYKTPGNMSRLKTGSFLCGTLKKYSLNIQPSKLKQITQW
jgi:hypothetical protein